MGGFDEKISVKIGCRANGCSLEHHVHKWDRITGVCINDLTLHDGFLGKELDGEEKKGKR